MENRLDISGVIGYDVTSKDVKEDLNSLTGDIEIVLNSPGGLVFQGISIYNAIKRYSNEKGKVKIIVDGISASMASVIMLAGDELEFESNAVAMIHNPWSYAFGDYRAMNKSSANLTMLRDTIANIYLQKTKIKPLSEIHTLMDNETYFAGDELKVFGKVKEDTSKAEDISTLKIVAIDDFTRSKDLLRKQKLEDTQEEEEVAAFLQLRKEPKALKKEEVEQKKENTMTTLEQVSPEIKAQIEKNAIKKERERVAAHLEFLESSPKAAIDAVKNGEEFTVAHSAKYTKEMGYKAKAEGKEKENPSDISQKVVSEKDEKEGESNSEKEIEEALNKAYKII